MTLSDVAQLTRLSWDTVKGITKAYLAREYGKPALRTVRYLGIDEIHVGTKGGFYTIVIDLDDGRILWVKPGRGKDALRGFWRRLRAAEADIKAVATDMSAAYWTWIRRIPDAKTCRTGPKAIVSQESYAAVGPIRESVLLR